jgi:hypothetical protein
MKKITVSNIKQKSTHRFQPELLANQLLSASGFKHGTGAYIKYAHGKLTIVVGKIPKVLE